MLLARGPSFLRRTGAAQKASSGQIPPCSPLIRQQHGLCINSRNSSRGSFSGLLVGHAFMKGGSAAMPDLEQSIRSELGMQSTKLPDELRGKVETAVERLRYTAS